VLWRAVRDAVTETAVGPALNVNVIIESDLVFSVSDDGVGIATDPIAPGHEPWLFEALTIPLLGAGAPDPPRGAGLAQVTALSSAVIVDAWRAGRHYRQWASWEYPPPAMQHLGPTTEHGTSLRVHLDPAYLGAHARRPDKPLAEGVHLSFIDHRAS
jgi:DNA gyrase/topoisomerase IV subunit B